MLTILKHFLLTGIDGRKAIRRIASRSPKDCVHRGLGLRLNKQKNHSFCGSGMDGFSHLYYRCIACQYYTKLGIIGYKSSKQCLWRAICETPRFHGSGSEGFLLVEALPQSPQNTESVFWKRWRIPAATRFCKSLNGHQRPSFSDSLATVRELSPRIRSTFAFAV